MHGERYSSILHFVVQARHASASDVLAVCHRTHRNTHIHRDTDTHTCTRIERHRYAHMHTYRETQIHTLANTWRDTDEKMTYIAANRVEPA